MNQKLNDGRQHHRVKLVEKINFCSFYLHHRERGKERRRVSSDENC